MGEDKKQTQKTSKWKSMCTEFKKIVWPDKKTLAKQTTAVVVITIILGILITMVDFIVKYGVDSLVR